MRYTGAQIIIAMLEREGVHTVSGIPGGANLPLYDAMADSNIRHILAAHEQGAGFIAQGMARVDGRPGVCLASSGPGVMNLLTAIADAASDSIPLVAITGQVSRSLIGTDAFQEVDAFTLSMPITKQSWLVRDASELPHLIPEAFRLASSGRPGPVLIDVPKDVFLQEIEIAELPAPSLPDDPIFIETNLIARAASMINQARRPIIYAGGGVIASWRRNKSHDACAALAAFARKSNSPVALSFMGLGAFPASDPLYLGMLGMHAAPFTNLAMDQADVIIALGVRFDDRATGHLASFCPNAKIIHVDIDASELGKLRQPDLSIRADVGIFLEAVIPQVQRHGRLDWRREIAAMRRTYPIPAAPVAIGELLSKVRHHAGADAIITTDVGQHQMWVAQHYLFERPGSLLSSGGMGTMGFGLPAAIGAAVASGKRVFCITGDGSILMNIQELATLAELNLPVTVVVFNNGHLGLVRQQQELFYRQRYHASRLTSGTNLAAVARGFGIPACSILNQNDENELAAALATRGGPILIDVAIDPLAMVLPIVASGKANRSSAGPWPICGVDIAAAMQVAGVVS